MGRSLKSETRRFPGEWEKHATWLDWPHYRPDWPGYFGPIELDVAEIVRLLSPDEQVNIICQSPAAKKRARKVCKDVHATLENCRFFVLPTNRSWLRDSGPTGILVNGKPRWISWSFQGWGKCYPNYRLDQGVPASIAKWTGIPLERPTWPDGEPVELEGGAIETNGADILMTTEQCLLGGPHWRNRGRTKDEYEAMFRKFLGVDHVLWLGRGFKPDQTQGHVDNVARFVSKYTILAAVPNDPDDPNYEIWRDNKRRIRRFARQIGRIVIAEELQSTGDPVMRCGERLPAGYINFYIGTKTVIVPVFNDQNDRKALAILQDWFPEKRVVGYYSRNLAWGYGGPHCLLQQQPL